MGRLLDILAEGHNTWMELAQSIGCGERSADVVQDMYIRMYKYEDRAQEFIDDGKLTGCNIYLVLRSVWIDMIRNDKEATLYDDCVLDEQIPDEDAGLLQGINAKIGKLQMNEQFIEDISDEDIRFAVYEEMAKWHWYDKALFDLYMGSDMTMRDIAKATGISLTSIYNTLKNGKEKIKKALDRVR